MYLGMGLRLSASHGGGAGWAYGLTADGYAPAYARGGVDGKAIALPAYGPELVTNGTFDADLTGWTDASTGPSTFTWSSGAGLLTYSGATARARSTFTTVPGKLYRLTLTKGANIAINVGSAVTLGDILATSTGTSIERYFVAVTTTTHFNFTLATGAETFDNVSVREVILGSFGTNLGANTYSMSVTGTGTATESPSGQLNLNAGASGTAIADKSITTVVGTRYRIICLNATTACVFQVGTSAGGTQTVPATAVAVGVNQYSFTATATTHHLRFITSTNATSTITNITVAEFTPGAQLRSATFAEAFAYTASSTTARTYIGSDGYIKNDLAADVPRYSWNSTRGKWELLLENASTNLCLHNSDFTNAAWTKSNMTAAKTATGPDGVANSASTLTATAGNATALQAITSGSSARITSTWIQRSVGSGTINITHDNGTTWTAVTVTSSWTRVENPSTTATNPTVGIRIVTSGDAVNVAYFQHEAQAFVSSAIPTAGSTVTRAIETCRYSPLVEAILQQPAASARVQALGIRPFSTSPRYIGTSGSNGPICKFSGVNTSVSTWNGSVELSRALGSGTTNAAVGVCLAYNSSGRSLSGNGSAASSDTNAALVGATAIYLGRSSSGGTDTGDGYYYTDTIWPFRITDANLPTTAAVPT